MKYEILDTVTNEVIAQYPNERLARRDQKLFNATKCAIFHGKGYVIRFAVRVVSK
jgi:hypothetical protein